MTRVWKRSSSCIECHFTRILEIRLLLDLIQSIRTYLAFFGPCWRGPDKICNFSTQMQYPDKFFEKASKPDPVQTNGGNFSKNLSEHQGPDFENLHQGSSPIIGGPWMWESKEEC